MNFACRSVALAIAALLSCNSPAAVESTVEWIVDVSQAGEAIDLTLYTLGQGGLSFKPMFDPHIDQIAQLQPQTIRVFVQEFFDLYPARGRFQWDKLDRFVEAILATGAKPILSLCFKPSALFPKIDQRVVHPTDYEEWEELIFRLVKHCNEERRFGIQYWEIGNEPDIGEDGGCPYLFQKEDYVIYYDHTARAIQRADARVKIGGPALAWYKSEIADALIEHCGKRDTPLHFLSWHVYQSDPNYFRKTIQEMKAKLAAYPKLKDTETIIDEWNMSLDKPNLAPGFQPAFVLQTTLAFFETGLSRSAYYHIRDFFVDEAVFAKFMSPGGAAFVAHWWNDMPQYDGLWDNQGRVRPAYYAFKLLSLIRGQRIPIQGKTPELNGLAAKNGETVHVVLWNFPESGAKENRQVTIRFEGMKAGQFRETRLNSSAPVNPLEIRRHGSVAELGNAPLQMAMPPYEIRWISVGP